MILKKLRPSITTFVGCVILNACAVNQNPNINKPEQFDYEHDFKVSVSANGKAVTDLDQELVHYLGLSEASIDCMQEGVKNREAMSFDFTVEDHGLRVNGFDSKICQTDLGLVVDDLITAIGITVPPAVQDFSVLFDQLKIGNNGSLTLRRRKKDHKVIYYLEK